MSAISQPQSDLTMPDCCVLLSAQSNDASVATFDDRLASAATSRLIPVVTA